MRNVSIKSVVIAGIVLLVLLALMGAAGLKMSETTVEGVEVYSKERVVRNSGDSVTSRYEVYTSEGSFKVEDTVLYGNFRSADLYGSLRENHCYDLTVVGWRVPLFSEMQNIVEAKEVKCTP